MNNKLNLTLRNEGTGAVKGKGCLEYLIAMADNLEKRPEFIKRNGSMTVNRMIQFRSNVTEVKINYNKLVGEFETNDPEITFQIILGCIQFLYTNMCDLLSYLPVGVFAGTLFTQGYELYLINKIEIFAIEIETLKQVEHIENRMIGGVPYMPIKIGDNLELYRYWKEHKNKEVIDITDITPFLTCKNWRRNMIKTTKNITFIEYFEKDDACKKADEKAEVHKRAKLEQTQIQISKQKAEDIEATEDEKNKSKKKIFKKETGTRI
jgi:hypothetical protein